MVQIVNKNFCIDLCTYVFEKKDSSSVERIFVRCGKVFRALSFFTLIIGDPLRQNLKVRLTKFCTPLLFYSYVAP